jgi:REP element-mobilizing transposase RayT
MERPNNRRPAVPYNPELRELIADKRSWSSRPKIEDLKKGFRGWHERAYLPHRDEPGLTQFVTFHLVDCFPKSLRSEWEYLAEIDDHREQRHEVEKYLDKGRGECYLRRPEVAQLVEDNFRNFSHFSSRNQSNDSNTSARYDLKAWVVMPNHVHVLFKAGSVSMSKTVAAWKTNTARLANKLLGREGQFWEADYFDVYMRDEAHERRTIRYIENNPTKAGLVLDPKHWLWSSARFRDETGALNLTTD